MEEIKNKIYTIRGLQVMLDKDVAELYQYEVKRVNEAVSRNINRFPQKFCFQLTKAENEILKSQIATSRLIGEKNHGGVRKLPYVFTEPGIYMLSGMLKSEIAEKVSVAIMEAFVEMKSFLSGNEYLLTAAERLKLLEYKQDSSMSAIHAILEEHSKQINSLAVQFKTINVPDDKIFMNGEVFDAYIALTTIFKKAKKNITIIDAYVDNKTLEYLSTKNRGVDVMIITKVGHRITEAAIHNFNTQYPNVIIKIYADLHDRFILLDHDMPDKKLYQCGTSIKDTGKKISTIVNLKEPLFLSVLQTIIISAASCK